MIQTTSYQVVVINNPKIVNTYVYPFKMDKSLNSLPDFYYFALSRFTICHVSRVKDLIYSVFSTENIGFLSLICFV